MNNENTEPSLGCFYISQKAMHKKINWLCRDPNYARDRMLWFLRDFEWLIRTAGVLDQVRLDQWLSFASLSAELHDDLFKSNNVDTLSSRLWLLTSNALASLSNRSWLDNLARLMVLETEPGFLKVDYTPLFLSHRFQDAGYLYFTCGKLKVGEQPTLIGHKHEA